MDAVVLPLDNVTTLSFPLIPALLTVPTFILPLDLCTILLSLATVVASASTRHVPFLSLAVPSFGPTIVVGFFPSDLIVTSPVFVLSPRVVDTRTFSVFPAVTPIVDVFGVAVESLIVIAPCIVSVGVVKVTFPLLGPTIVVSLVPADFTVTPPVSSPAAVKPLATELSSTPLTLLTCISLLESL